MANLNIPSLNIALLGKTGNGKSATGNTILLENIFSFSNTMNSSTKLVERSKKVIGNYNVQVFDTPGPYDTDNNTPDIDNKCSLMKSMIAAADQDGGMHAFFLVININNKLTIEEMTTIKRLEDIFGNRVFNEFGVLIFTHGDNLDEDFTEWRGRQGEKVQELLDKFNNRFVVTNNKGIFLGERLQCSQNMIQEAVQLQTLIRNRVYTMDNYMSSESSRTYLFVDSKKDVLTAQFLERINTLENEINGCKSINTRKETDFLCKINEIIGGIKQANQGTNLLDGLYVHLDKLKMLVKNKAQSCSIL